MPENPYNANTHKTTIKGKFNLKDSHFDEFANTLSFHGQNGVIYTLSDPPKSADLAPKADAPSAISVKKGLVSFLLETSPNDITHMITQSNNIFAFEYKSFYNDIRAYIRHCLGLYNADEELTKSKESDTLVSRYDKLVSQSSELKRDVNVVEVNIEKAKGYMAPLEARVMDMKELLEKLEIELDERKTDLRYLEAMKMRKVEEFVAVDVELKFTAQDDEKLRGLIRDKTARRETARIRMEKARNQLRII